ncbi:MAG TPA: hypothetical protein VFE62_16860 [Gemmataceae bacterium]|nr:hypothetical protein [Gemmataceae bacterium]
MAVIDKSSAPCAANSDSEVQRLEALVGDLQTECAKLRDALAKAESEREAYRHLFLNEARERGEFRDVDFDDLIRTSPGPVETL